MHEAGVAKQNRVNVQTQRDCKVEKGGRVALLEEEAEELEKVMIKLRIQAEIDEGTIEDVEAVLEASARELSEVRMSSLIVCFYVGSYIAQPEALLLAKKRANVAMAEHSAVKEKHTATQTALVTDPKTTALYSGGGGYMGQIAKARA